MDPLPPRFRCLPLLVCLCPTLSAQNQLWTRQFGTQQIDSMLTATPDASGGVYSAGYTGGSLGAPPSGWVDIWIARFDGAGMQLWRRQLGASGFDAANASAPDGLGGAYFGGTTDGSLAAPNAGLYDAWLARYDAQGSQLWVLQLGTARYDLLEAAAPDGAGGVFIAGYTDGTLGGVHAGGNDAWVARYDALGNRLWIRQLGSASSDEAHALASDGAGGVYVGGHTGGLLGGSSPGGRDAWVARYDGAGGLLWVRQLGSSESDELTGAAEDGAGGVFVGGITVGSLAGSSLGGHDAWLARLDVSGAIQWTRQLGTHQGDAAYVLASDGRGGVLLGGATLGNIVTGGFGSSQDAWVAHYAAVGSRTWVRQIGTGGSDAALAMAAGPAGDVFVGGYTDGPLDGPLIGNFDAWLARVGAFGAARYCSPAAPNSLGLAARLEAVGSNAVQDNDLTLIARRLPLNRQGYFLTSQTTGFVPNAGGSEGNLCVVGSIGRFVGPGQMGNSGSGGAFVLTIDLTQHPLPTGLVTVAPGSTWSFQCWYRDSVASAATSNFTDALSVTF